VNGKKITKPSKILKKGDFVQIKFLDDFENKPAHDKISFKNFNHLDEKLPFSPKNPFFKDLLSTQFMEKFSKNQLTKNFL